MIYKEEYYSRLSTLLPRLKMILGLSYGTSGSHVLLKEDVGYVFSRSGRQILENIEAEDPYEKSILNILKKTITGSEILQDSSTLSALVTCELVLKSLKYLVAGANHENFCSGIKTYHKELDQHLKSVGRPYTTTDFIGLVNGLLNNDLKAQELFLEAFSIPDENLFVTVMENDFGESTVSKETGCVFKAVPVENRNGNFRFQDLDQGLFFVIGQKINHTDQLNNILKDPSPLHKVVVAKAFGEQANSLIRSNAFQESSFYEIGDDKELQDLAALLGMARPLSVEDPELQPSPALGVHLDEEQIIVKHLKSHTLDNYIFRMKLGQKELKSFREKEALQKRMARLSGNDRIISVGANTPTETRQQTMFLRNAAFQLRMIIKHGMLPGGGASLFYASRKIPWVEDFTDDYSNGGKTMKNSIQLPMELLIQNAGCDPEYYRNRMKEIDRPETIFDTSKKRLVDLKNNPIYDSLELTRQALSIAVHTAIQLLNVELVVNNSGQNDT